MRLKNRKIWRSASLKEKYRRSNPKKLLCSNKKKPYHVKLEMQRDAYLIMLSKIKTVIQRLETMLLLLKTSFRRETNIKKSQKIKKGKLVI